MRDNAAKRRFRPLPLAAAIAMALVPATSQAVTYVVTNGLDNGGIDPPFFAGTNTLRQAIVDANFNCLSDPNPIITFAIGTSPAFINIGSPSVTTNNPLPPLQCLFGPFNPTIDGTTQPGHVNNSDPTGYNGTHGITIIGNGLTASGQCGLAFTQPNTPGGALTLRGIRFSGFNASGSNAGVCGTNMIVLGGTFDNNVEGVKVLAGGTATIGNNTPADRNLIHANSFAGVNSVSAGTVNVVNSFIGTTPDGNSPLPNAIGILAQNTASVQLNGNVISGNSSEGVRLLNTPGLILGNSIGLGSLGGPLPNQTGIRTDATASLLNIFNNSIKNNVQFGIHVASGSSVRMTGNSITANNVANVTFNGSGTPTPNDGGDGDAGPNNQQNFPVITSVTQGGGNTTVNYTFNSSPSGLFEFHFYSNAAAGIPAGETPQNSTSNNATDAAGNLSGPGSQVITGLVDFISMTATNQASNETSEFSAIVAATAGPAVTIAPPNLAFGNVAINTTSPNMSSTLTSTGAAPWQISQFSTGSCYGGPICYGGAEFTCMTDCVPFTPYAPSAFCTLTANFQPTVLGPQTMNLVVCDNAIGSPRTIVLSGTGVPPPTLTVSPGTFDFGNVAVGSTSPPAFFIVQNPGASPVSFTAGTNGPFSVLATNCLNPVPAGGSCSYDVGFNPTAAGFASGNFFVQPPGGAFSTASLMGNGVLAPLLSVPASLDIVYTLGTAPATQVVTVANVGGAALAISGITISGANFTLLNNCPASLLPGSSCDLVIGFSASAPGTFNGTLSVVTNAPGGSRAIPLRGLSQPRNVPILEVKPREIGYGGRALGTVTEGERVTLRNIGGAPLAFNSLVASIDFTILSHTCTRPLATLETCEALVAMSPMSFGAKSGHLRILSNAENNPTDVTLFGTSCRTSGLVVPRLGSASGCTP